MKHSSDFLEKELERDHIYSTAPTCSFCGGTMLPLNLTEVHGYRCSVAWLCDDVPGDLKACDHCGIVKFYPDTKE